MTDLPYTYTDVDGDYLRIGKGAYTAYDPSSRKAVSVTTPTGEDAVAVARAVLAAAGDTGHEVVEVALVSRTLRSAEEEGARSMRERAIEALGSPQYAAAAIRALPLLPDSEGDRLSADIDQLQTDIKHIKDTGGSCASFTAHPNHPGDALYCEHPMGSSHTGRHYADTWSWSGATEPGAEVAHLGVSQPASETPTEQPATVHVATPEGITPCGEGHPDVTVSAFIDEATCVECLRATAIQKSDQVIEVRRERDRLRTAWESARHGRTQQRDALRKARRARDRYRDERNTARAERAAARRYVRILEAQRADLRREVRAAETRLPEDDMVDPDDQEPSLESRVEALEQQYTDLANLTHGHSEDLARLRRRFTAQDDG